MPSAEICEVCASDIGWDFEPPSWWIDPPCDDEGDHASIDPKLEELLSQEVPF